MKEPIEVYTWKKLITLNNSNSSSQTSLLRWAQDKVSKSSISRHVQWPVHWGNKDRLSQHQKHLRTFGKISWDVVWIDQLYPTYTVSIERYSNILHLPFLKERKEKVKRSAGGHINNHTLRVSATVWHLSREWI